MSSEGPIVHDAHAGAVVDVRTGAPPVKDLPDPKRKETEVWFQVDQLLKDARQSIRKTPNLKVSAITVYLSLFYSIYL